MKISMVYTGHKPNSPVTSHQIIGQKKNNELIIPNNVRPSINDISELMPELIFKTYTFYKSEVLISFFSFLQYR